jgi:hypothetical protein
MTDVLQIPSKPWLAPPVATPVLRTWNKPGMKRHWSDKRSEVRILDNVPELRYAPALSAIS